MARPPSKPQVEPATTLGPLKMIFAAASRYPAQVSLALVALVVTAAATLAIPSGFRLIIDRGFAQGADPAEIGRWFRYLFLIYARGEGGAPEQVLLSDRPLLLSVMLWGLAAVVLVYQPI